MRQKSDLQRHFSWATGASCGIVLEYEQRYNRLSEILEKNPEILELVHNDLRKLSNGSGSGRRSDFTSENLLRALVVHQVEGTSFRGTMVRICHSFFLQDFVKLGSRRVPHYTLIDRAFKVIQPSTWKEINELLNTYALKEGRLDPTTLRVDTTLVEANIHYPTDSSLLWDSWRVLYRLLEKARKVTAGRIENRFHARKVKKLHIRIGRYSSSRLKESKRHLRNCYKELIKQIERISAVAGEFSEVAKNNSRLRPITSAIRSYLPKILRVVQQSRRAWVHGETVPAKERIFSIFEDHVELIMRGRKHKPVEFGHKVLLGKTRDKFITQYDVMKKEIRDVYLSEPILKRHRKTFGSFPHTLAADKGFRGKQKAMDKIMKKVKVLAIPKRLGDFADATFVALQHFRAGIEGSISVLKRAFGLLRCQYRGFKSFQCHVALGVFTHNLVILARAPPSQIR